MVKSLAKDLVEIDVPAVFEETAKYEMVATKSDIPYVVFAQPKAHEQFMELAMKLPGLQDGDPVMVHPEPKAPERLQPMRFTMLACKQYWLQKDGAGQTIGKPSATQQSRIGGWKEEVLAACIVYVPRGGELEAIPASCIFKTVKCPAAMTLKLEIEAAEKPEWAENSSAHKMAFSALAKPWSRVVATVQISGRTSGKGFSYAGARSRVSPATPAEWKALKDLLEAGGVEKLKKLHQHYVSRLIDTGL